MLLLIGVVLVMLLLVTLGFLMSVEDCGTL
jgi:hypothetical protein